MGSFLDDLRGEADLVAANAELLIPVPPSALHVIKCRPPARAKLDAVLAAYRVGRALTVDEELQLVVDVCDEILRRDPATGEIGPVDDEGGLRFDASDPRWGDDVKTARDCVVKLFKLDVKPLAASGPVEVIVDWLQRVSDQGLKRVEGKSAGAEGS